METIATIKGQIVIPSSVRRKFGIREGTRIQIQINEANHQIVLTPITPEYIHSLRGSLKGGKAMKALMDERQKEKVR